MVRNSYLLGFFPEAFLMLHTQYLAPPSLFCLQPSSHIKVEKIFSWLLLMVGHHLNLNIHIFQQGQRLQK